MGPDRWLQIEDEPAQRGDGFVEALDGFRDHGGDLGHHDLLALRLQRKSDGEEVLDDRVVKIPCDSLSIFHDGETSQPPLQASRVHRSAGDDGETLHRLLVCHVEAAVLVSEIEVPEDFSPQPDRHPEKRVHVGMTFRKP